ncbi:Regulatory protein BlaR1 [Posidoniimonas polymericola]|uniref:Regulatory protein BlaR1 n=1 Tax=Posidoniimonas polymericola TaxID=2528002 RepID=A0A5C5ZE80_9BACT|nr:M56 family metallopeptidase [Posidoniimonas polymericola]TWT85460.1 Regulatory protein BlaR1 [Posidoniimonas polymericola]
MNLSAYLTPQTSAWLVESLAHVLWQGTLAAVLAALACLVLRRRDARARYAVYCAALGLTAACLPLNLWLTAPGVAAVAPAVAGLTPEASPAGAIGPTSTDYAPGLAVEPPSTLSRTAGLPKIEAAPEPPVAVNAKPEPSWESASQWLVTAYVVGAGAMAIRLLLGLYGCQRLRATARPIEESRLPELLARIGERVRLDVLPLVAYSTRVATPVVVGVVKPAILLPAAILNQLTTEQVESLLLHELAHIRRYDHLVNLLQRVVEAALFFHPAVWWLSHKIGVEREHCCDDLAIRWGSEPCDYAESLVRLSELRYQTAGLSTAGAAALAATGPRASQLRGRVLRVLGMPLPGPSVGLTRVGVGALLLASGLLFASPTLWQAEAANEDKPTEESVLEHGESEGTATLSGQIVLEDGAAATVKGNVYYYTRYANGNFASIAGKSYVDRFSMEVDAGTSWLTYYAEGHAPAWTEQLELAPGEHRDDIKLVLRPGVSQRVRVVNEQGDPIPGATLVAHPEIHTHIGGPNFEFQTDQRGEHVLQHLAATRYSFRVEAPGYEPLLDRIVELRPGKVIALELVAAAKTNGVVRGPDGKPLAGAKIRLVHEVNPSSNRAFSDQRRHEWWGEAYATTDDRGAFTLDRLTRGSRYLAIFEADDGARAVYHGLEAGQSLEIVVPERRDLFVNLTGDLSRLKKGNWDPRVSVRQRVTFEPWPEGATYAELLGAGVVIESTPTGGRAVLRGLAVDLNAAIEEQEVEVYLPGNEGYEQTVGFAPEGDTVVEIKIRDNEPAETDAAPSEEQPASANAADGPTPDSLVRTALEQLREAVASIRTARLQLSHFHQGPSLFAAGSSPNDLAQLAVEHNLVEAPDALTDLLQAANAMNERSTSPWSQLELYLQMSDGRPTHIRESRSWPGRDESHVHIQADDVSIQWDEANSQLDLAPRAADRLAITTLRDVLPVMGPEFLDKAAFEPARRTMHRGKTASVANVASPAGDAASLFFDPESGLPIELVLRHGATERRSQWLGWRRQSGVPVPTVITQFESRAGQIQRASILRVGLARFNTPLPESVFQLGAPAGATVVDTRDGHSVRRLQRDVFDVTSREEVRAATETRRRELTETEQRAVDELRQAYVLADGEVLNRFGPPYPLARNYLRHLLRPGSAPGRQEFFYFLKWQDGKPEHHFGIGGRAPKLADLTTYLLRQPSVDVDIAEELLTLPLPGDYLFRADATRDQLAEALSQLVSDELGRPVRVVFEQVDRLVYIASGTLALNEEEMTRRSIRGEDQAVLTVNSGPYEGDHGEQISFGDLPNLLTDLGEYIGVKVVNDTPPSSERLTWSKRWYDTNTVPKEKRFRVDPDTVLQAVTAQTGVEFEKSSSQVTILRVRDH